MGVYWIVLSLCFLFICSSFANLVRDTFSHILHWKSFRFLFFCNLFLRFNYLFRHYLFTPLCIILHQVLGTIRARQRQTNLGNRVALLPGKFLPSGKFSYIYMIFFRTKSGIFLDSMGNLFIYSGKVSRPYLLPDKFLTRFWRNFILFGTFSESIKRFHSFWKISAPGQVSHKIPDKNFFLSETFPDSLEKFHLFWKNFLTISVSG